MRRKPRRNHLKHLTALAASWNVLEPSAGAPGARGGSDGSPQRFLEIQAELQRRQQDTAAQLQELVAQKRLSLQSANLKMAEVKQVRCLPLHACARL